MTSVTPARGWYQNPFQTGGWCYDGTYPPPPMPPESRCDIAPIEEAYRLRQALAVIRDMPLPEQDNMLAANMRRVAAEALS